MLSQLITKLITGEAGTFFARMKRVMGLYVVMAFFALATLMSLLLALYVFLAQVYGPLPAALGFAAVWFVLVIVTWIAVIIARRPPKKRADDRLQRDIASIAGVAAMSNLPLILGTVKRRKSLLLLPAVAAGGWGIWRAIGAYRRDSRYD
ncbi:hypothetical protein VQ042_05480 [Aurantimonas sp. A2-1-M11]|uniref:hypothetical protein n=1 Tax=Aurantimonas sp. A2-1-M11 TaxID=3113712 RepID=UPI002F943D19